MLKTESAIMAFNSVRSGGGGGGGEVESARPPIFCPTTWGAGSFFMNFCPHTFNFRATLLCVNDFSPQIN